MTMDHFARFCAQLGAASMEPGDVRKKFSFREELGFGAQGYVTRVTDSAHAVDVALKAVNASHEGKRSAALKEVKALRTLRDDHIVRLRDVLWCEPFVYLVLDLAPTTLACVLAWQTLTSATAIRYARGLFHGLAACHAARIAHCDVKPENLLIGADDEIQLADFGCARFLDDFTEIVTHYVGTLPYRAPELLMGSDHVDEAVDVWSAGCVLMAMGAGKAVVVGDNAIDQLLRLFKLLGTPSPTEWAGIDAFPRWSSLFPTWSPVDTTYENVRRIGLEQAARRSFALVPSSRWDAARLGALL